MSLARCPDSPALKRGNYIRILQRWEARGGRVWAEIPAGITLVYALSIEGPSGTLIP